MSRDELLAYWEARAKEGRDDCERVEQSRRAQRMRFEAFVLTHELAGRSLLDVGCGTGDLLDHLRARGIACDYLGTDLSPSMIERCRARFPDGKFEVADLESWQPGRRFDYTVSIGIHNVRVPGARETLERGMRRQFELCGVAAHLSLLTDRFPGFADHILPWRAEEILGLALTITPFVVLRHDYLPNDFSVTLYRKPLIDTRRDLRLG
jgi:SAM-dependent methyltransferase